MDGGGVAAGVGGVAQPNRENYRAGGWWYELRYRASVKLTGASALVAEPGVEIRQLDIGRTARHTLPFSSHHRRGRRQQQRQRQQLLLQLRPRMRRRRCTGRRR